MEFFKKHWFKTLFLIITGKTLSFFFNFKFICFIFHSLELNNTQTSINLNKITNWKRDQRITRAQRTLSVECCLLEMRHIPWTCWISCYVLRILTETVRHCWPIGWMPAVATRLIPNSAGQGIFIREFNVLFRTLAFGWLCCCPELLWTTDDKECNAGGALLPRCTLSAVSEVIFLCEH